MCKSFLSGTKCQFLGSSYFSLLSGKRFPVFAMEGPEKIRSEIVKTFLCLLELNTCSVLWQGNLCKNWRKGQAFNSFTLPPSHFALLMTHFWNPYTPPHVKIFNSRPLSVFPTDNLIRSFFWVSSLWEIPEDSVLHRPSIIRAYKYIICTSRQMHRPADGHLAAET